MTGPGTESLKVLEIGPTLAEEYESVAWWSDDFW
jgi:hypothetical protein